jgi:major membrane immunogen (membrane-anchored lipoprotein)
MKKYIFLVLAAFLLLVSCGGSDYPAFTYTNNSTADSVTFRTGERAFIVYSLGTGSSLTLDSEERGREEILDSSIVPVTVGWRRMSGDIYSIEFLDKKELYKDLKLPVTIENKTVDTITLKEKNGFMDPNEIAEITSAGKSLTDAIFIYTEKPIFEVSGNNLPVLIKYDITAGTMTITIDYR